MDVAAALDPPLGKKEVVCEHLASINVPSVTTDNIFRKINTLEKFTRNFNGPM